MTDKEIKRILKQETEIPAVVEDTIMDTLNEIKAAKRRRNIHSKASRGMAHYIKIAAVWMIAVLCAGMTTYAAVRYFGLFDFLKDRGMTQSEEITELIDETSKDIKNTSNDVSDVGDSVNSNGYAGYKVVEAVCDDEVIYMVIEITPEEKEKYLPIPQYCMPEDSVSELSMDGLSEGTIGDYAAQNGKELLYTGVGVFMDGELISSAADFRSTQDGRAYYCITGTNPSAETELNLNVMGTAYTEGAAEVSRCEFACTLFHKSSSTEEMYHLRTNDLEAETGIILDQAEVSKTELGMYITFHYHAENGESLDDYFFELVDENGNAYNTMPYFAGGGTEKAEGTGYTRMSAYQMSELSDTLYVKVRDVNGGSFGPYALGK